MDDIIKNDLAHFYSYIPPHFICACLPRPRSGPPAYRQAGGR